LNSGWLWPLFNGPVGGVNYYDLTFTTVGTHRIYCELHEEMGMVQYVEVLAAI